MIEERIDKVSFIELLYFQFFKALKMINAGNIVNRNKSTNTIKIVEPFMSRKIIYLKFIRF